MKPHSHFLKSINPNPLRRCVNILTSLASRCSLAVRWLSTLVRTNLWSHPTVHVVRAALAGLNALILTTSSHSNRRLLIGLGFMGGVAPLSSCFYMLFDWRTNKIAGWYHDNLFHFFLLLAPYFALFFCLVGVWFLFPEQSKRAYALIIPGGYTIGKILWLAQVSNDAEFYSVVPLAFIGLGLLISVFLFIAFDWLAHVAFHRDAAFNKRIHTLYNGADLLDAEQFRGLFKKYVEEKRAFHKQF